MAHFKRKKYSGVVVSALALFSDDPSSDPAEI